MIRWLISWAAKFGKNKLSPELSPKKTVEGRRRGNSRVCDNRICDTYAYSREILYAIFTGCIFCFGCLVSSIFATVGDLIASAVKRIL